MDTLFSKNIERKLNVMSLNNEIEYSRKKRYPFFPLILFLTTYLLVQLYHYDIKLFGLTISLALSLLGIWYFVRATNINSRYQTTTMMNVDAMTDQEFHQLLISLFRRQGYSVNSINTNEQNCADLIAIKNGTKAVVYAKRQQAIIDKQVIQDALLTKKTRQATQVIVVTNNPFSHAAKKLAQANKVNLIDRDSLDALLDAYFRQKRSYRFIERARAFFIRQETEN